MSRTCSGSWTVPSRRTTTRTWARPDSRRSRGSKTPADNNLGLQADNRPESQAPALEADRPTANKSRQKREAAANLGVWHQQRGLCVRVLRRRKSDAVGCPRLDTDHAQMRPARQILRDL